MKAIALWAVRGLWSIGESNHSPRLVPIGRCATLQRFKSEKHPQNRP